MPRIFPEYKRSTEYALLGAVFHVVIVVIPLLLSGGTGEAGKTVGWFVIILDFPLMFILNTALPNALGFIWYFSLCGTLLYALGGWLIGYITDKYSQRRLNKTENDQNRKVMAIL